MCFFLCLCAYLGSDYTGEDIPIFPILFNPSDLLKCFDLGIVDDNVVEPPESFSITLLQTDLQIESSSTVNIEDDDGTCRSVDGLFFSVESFDTLRVPRREEENASRDLS